MYRAVTACCTGIYRLFQGGIGVWRLYVGIGSDATVYKLKHRHTICSGQERLYMVRAIRYVKDACINRGSGMLDFEETVERLQPDIFVVNEDGASEAKRLFCQEHKIEYVVLQRTPEEGLTAMFPAMVQRCARVYRPICRL